MSIIFKIIILVIYVLALAGCIFWWIKEGGWEPKVAILTSTATLALFAYDWLKDTKNESINSISISENTNSPIANNIQTQNNYYSNVDTSILKHVLEPKNEDILEKKSEIPKIDTRKQEQQVGDINIVDNAGNAQVNVNSPGSKQIINQKRVIRNDVSVEKARKNDLYLLRLTFHQTDGIWDVGKKFWMQLQLSGAYKEYRFLSGYPPTLPLYNVRSTKDVLEAANKGWIELETSTPPINEPIILEIESTSEVNVEKILLQPTIKEEKQ